MATAGIAYLDHAATTPMRPSALEAYVDACASTGSAWSGHAPGRAARRRLEDARDAIAVALGSTSHEVVLTRGGTEADNLGVLGLYRARQAADSRRRRVVLSAVEHPAVAAAADALAAGEGAVVERVPVDAAGVVAAADVAAALERDPGTVALVACMWANNEVGAIQPVADVVAAARRHGVPVHVDAVQAVGSLPVDAAALGADTLAVSGHKVGGPAGSGALVVDRAAVLRPVLHGGGAGHERGLRPGTPDVPAAAGLAAALTETVADRAGESERLSRLRDRLLAGVVAAVPGARASGPSDPATRLPTIAHATLPGCDGETLTLLLDDCGVAASAGAACSTGAQRPSPVLLAMGRDAEEARAGLRLSLGRTSTDADVDAVLAVLPDVVSRARAARAAGAIAGGQDRPRVAVATA